MLCRTTSLLESYLALVAILSTTQVDYIMLTKGLKKTLWLKGMLGVMEFEQYCVKMTYILVEYINVKLHFIRGIVEFEKVRIMKITS